MRRSLRIVCIFAVAAWCSLALPEVDFTYQTPLTKWGGGYNRLVKQKRYSSPESSMQGEHSRRRAPKAASSV